LISQSGEVDSDGGGNWPLLEMSRLLPNQYLRLNLRQVDDLLAMNERNTAELQVMRAQLREKPCDDGRSDLGEAAPSRMRRAHSPGRHYAMDIRLFGLAWNLKAVGVLERSIAALVFVVPSMILFLVAACVAAVTFATSVALLFYMCGGRFSFGTARAFYSDGARTSDGGHHFRYSMLSVGIGYTGFILLRGLALQAVDDEWSDWFTNQIGDLTGGKMATYFGKHFFSFLSGGVASLLVCRAYNWVVKMMGKVHLQPARQPPPDP
jgi:hypothetical protein